MLCGLRDLSSLTKDRTQAMAVKAYNPNHWATREFPQTSFLNSKFCLILYHRIYHNVYPIIYTDTQLNCFKFFLFISAMNVLCENCDSLTVELLSQRKMEFFKALEIHIHTYIHIYVKCPVISRKIQW